MKFVKKAPFIAFDLLSGLLGDYNTLFFKNPQATTSIQSKSGNEQISAIKLLCR